MQKIDIRTMPTNQLVDSLEIAKQQGDQVLINNLAFELTYRTYIPFREVTFDEMVTKFGYKEIKQEKWKQYIKK